MGFASATVVPLCLLVVTALSGCTMTVVGRDGEPVPDFIRLDVTLSVERLEGPLVPEATVQAFVVRCSGFFGPCDTDRYALVPLSAGTWSAQVPSNGLRYVQASAPGFTHEWETLDVRQSAAGLLEAALVLYDAEQEFDLEGVVGFATPGADGRSVDVQFPVAFSPDAGLQGEYMDRLDGIGLTVQWNNTMLDRADLVPSWAMEGQASRDQWDLEPPQLGEGPQGDQADAEGLRGQVHAGAVMASVISRAPVVTQSSIPFQLKATFLFEAEPLPALP